MRLTVQGVAWEQTPESEPTETAGRTVIAAVFMLHTNRRMRCDFYVSNSNVADVLGN